MTEIERKALLNECAGQEVYGGWGTFDPNQSPCTRALCRAIEQHEAFRQEVSDAVEEVFDVCGEHIPLGTKEKLRRFIIAKPDPLVEAFGHDLATDIRAAIEKLGVKIEGTN